MSHSRIAGGLLAATLLTVSLPCAAQLGALGDLARKIGGERSSPAAASAVPSRGDAADAGLMPVKPNANVEDKLRPDLQCQRFEERSDVWQALAEYGGNEAQARMTRLLAADFKFADLTPEDKKMLRYIAYTTVWVPQSVESGFGKLYVEATRRNRDTGGEDRSEAAQLARVKAQLVEFRSHIDSFPGSVDLVVDKNMATGAYSQVGGLIVLSPDFLNRMDEKDSVKQLILAHELSHLYKRHTVKELQYQLVTSSSGFGLAKKLLGRYNPQNSSNPLEIARNAMEYAKVASELYDFVRSRQVAFTVDQEFEADACSVQFMTRSGLDPKPLVPALAELEAVQKEEASGYAKTHPSNRERQDKLLVATGQHAPPSAVTKATSTLPGKAKTR